MPLVDDLVVPRVDVSHGKQEENPVSADYPDRIAVGTTLEQAGHVAGSTCSGFLIAPTSRPWIIVALLSADLIGAKVAALISWWEAGSAHKFLIFGSIFVFAAKAFHFYAATSSTDLEQSTKGALAASVIFVPIALALAWLAVDRETAWVMACAATAGILTSAICRAAVTVAVKATRKLLTERVLIVGRCDPANRFLESGRIQGGRVRVVGQVVIGDGDAAGPLLGRMTGGADPAPHPVASFDQPELGVDRVLIMRSGLTDREFADALTALEAVPYPVYMMANLPVTKTVSCLPESVCLVLRPAPVGPVAMIVKRSLDIVVSLFALLFIAPVLVIIAVLIRLETPGPVLFRQTRLGLGNRAFTVYKFRTMRVGVQGTDGSIQATRNDARVTRVGAFLRKTSLDEVPQVFNVLNGTMSLVGPRPHPTELNRRFVPLIDSYTARHRIAPGITGWAQVNGFRGETSTVDQMQRRVEHDLEYIERHSIAFDLWIILRTVFALIAPRNAY